MKTATVKHIQTDSLDVEVDLNDAGEIVVSAWERKNGRLGDPVFLCVSGQRLSEVVDLVAVALAPERAA